MASSLTPDKLLQRIDDILSVWKDNAELVLKFEDKVDPEKAVTITYAQALKMRETFQKLLDTIADLERQLGDRINARHDQFDFLDEIRSRALSLIRGTFGADSKQYEKAGGTRQSEKKTGLTRKKKAKPDATGGGSSEPPTA